jgi:hypothetical protein
MILFKTAECQPLEIDLKRLPKKVSVNLSDLGATDIQYVPLETTETSVIPRINKIIFSKNYFLTHSYANINMFRYDGSFVTKIGNEGRGPNEFTIAHDVDINPQNESIYLVDGWLKKFLVYNKNGKFIRTFKSPLVGAVYFRITKDGILCYNQNNMANIKYSFNLIDTTGKIIKYFPNSYPWQEVTKPAVGFTNENIFYCFNGQLFKKEIYCDTVFVFTNKNFEPHLIIDVGNLRLTPDARTKSTADFIFQNFLTPMNLFEFGDFVFYEFIAPFYGKREGLAFIGSKKNDFAVLFNPEKGLINDLDGGPSILPKTIKDNNTIVAWIDALKLKTYIASEAFKNSKPKFPEKKKELEKLVNRLKETDNPVLVLVKLKK